MEEEYISKKDLLQIKGISYGQLYRWKRKNLIPEEWFIRKSTFTGQETFFPREKILSRVDKIMNMKEDLSLSDLADVFSPNLTGIVIKKQSLLEQKITSKYSIDCFVESFGNCEEFNFKKILFIYALDKIFESGKTNINEGKMILQMLDENYSRLEGKNYDLVFIRIQNAASCFLTSSPNELYFESNTYIIKLNLVDCIEELKLKII